MPSSSDQNIEMQAEHYMILFSVYKLLISCIYLVMVVIQATGLKVPIIRTVTFFSVSGSNISIVIVEKIQCV